MTSAKIYKISSSIGPKCYIGSTTKLYLSNRWAGHRSDYRHKKHNCATKELFDEYGIENCKCELLEEVEFKDKSDYLERERYYIENTANCVNIKKPIESQEEAKANAYNKDRMRKEKNPEEYLAKKRAHLKVYRDKHTEPILCECGIHYSVQHKARHLKTARHTSFLNTTPEERENERKQKSNDKSKLYYKRHKEDISEKRKECITCVCGSSIQKLELSRHLKSKKHQSLINSKT
jgi:hypothetical protein